ncbi:MAG: DUF1549 domain-containing protein [Planctomycetota bacterium]|nr:DUF1549 domain-containing protein [Planctomycetota bacterium]
MGSFTLTGCAPTCDRGEEAFFDSIILGPSIASLDAYRPGAATANDATDSSSFGDAWTDKRNPIRRIFRGQRLDLWSLKKPRSHARQSVGDPQSGRSRDEDPLSGQRGHGSTSAPIDAFIRERLAKENLTPAPSADRRTLIRRLTFDLIGLPPTLDEVAAFVADQAPDAYHKLVKRLLDSPRYGERQARLWLDVVRYADTNGYERDEFRPLAWQYRDYVIRSFNQDKPFDQFIREQLANDELVDGAPKNPAGVAPPDNDCDPCVDGGEADSADTGHPVYLHSGEFTHGETDLEIPGRGLNWRFQRVYRSGIQFAGPLGYGWDFTDNRRLVETNADNLETVQSTYPDAKVGDVIRMNGLGRIDLYSLNTDGSYTHPSGYYQRLAQNTDGTFTERDRSGFEWDYAAVDADGLARITSRADRNGNTIAYEYDTDGQIDQVIDTLGRAIDFRYVNKRIDEIEDFDGRVVKFTYDGQGDLVSVRSPIVSGTPNGNDFADGKTIEFTYSSGFEDPRLNHNLLTITRPNEVATSGPAYFTLTYQDDAAADFSDRVLTQTLGGTNASTVPGGGTITYSYEILGTSPAADDFNTAVSRNTVTDRNGNQTVYEFNQLGNIVLKSEKTNRNVRAGDPDSFDTTLEYNSDGEMTRRTDELGTSASYVFSDDISDRFQHGNPTTRTTTADPRGGDQTTITTTTVFEPIYNQVHRTVDPRGNDPSYVPQNGGANSAARYTTTRFFDYQEGDNAAALGTRMGISESEVSTLLAEAGIALNLGDLNGDGITNQITGNVIKIVYPSVTLLSDSNQAVLEGDTLQNIEESFQFNAFGQRIQHIDPEGNVHTWEYYPESDPDGDGNVDNANGNTTTGGYIKQTTIDPASGATRNSGTNPAPANIRNVFEYDDVGNVTRTIDARGIATDFVVNELNQVVQITHASAHGLLGADPAEPTELTGFQYIERFEFDHNNTTTTSCGGRSKTAATPATSVRTTLPARLTWWVPTSMPRPITCSPAGRT